MHVDLVVGNYLYSEEISDNIQTFFLHTEGLLIGKASCLLTN